MIVSLPVDGNPTSSQERGHFPGFQTQSGKVTEKKKNFLSGF